MFSLFEERRRKRKQERILELSRDHKTCKIHATPEIQGRQLFIASIHFVTSRLGQVRFFGLMAYQPFMVKILFTYDFYVNCLSVTFLNEPKLICLYSVDWLQAMLTLIVLFAHSKMVLRVVKINN